MGLIVLPLLRLIAWTYAWLPRPLRQLWSSTLGTLLRLTGYRAAVVRSNLEIAYPGNSAAQIKLRSDIFKSSYTSLANVVFEELMLLGPLKSYILRHAELRGQEHWREATQHGKGAIFVSSHLGSWEIMAARGAQSGIDIMIVTKHLKPEWLHQAIEKARYRCGVKATYEPRTMRDVLGQLKKGATVGFSLDQYAGPPIGVRVPFFNIPVGTLTTVAVLAKRTGAAVLPVVNYRLSNGRHIVEIRPPVVWLADTDPAQETALNTAAYAALLERDVRTFPEQWLWVHRRFKGDLSPLRPGEWSEGRVRA